MVGDAQLLNSMVCDNGDVIYKRECFRRPSNYMNVILFVSFGLC